MNKWKTKFSYWKFDKKILLLVTVSILIVTLTVAGVSLTFSIASMIVPNTISLYESIDPLKDSATVLFCICRSSTDCSFIDGFI